MRNLKNAAINEYTKYTILQFLGGWCQFCKVVSRIIVSSSVSLIEYGLLVLPLIVAVAV
jgi:hypothetical protein